MKRIISIMIIACLSLSLSGCFGYHAVKVRSGHEDKVTSCPKYARTGETVRIETVSVTDADIYVSANGTECKYVSEGVYEFVMPDENVEISVVIVSNGLA